MKVDLAAIYVGIGLALCQLVHTYFAMGTYEQKEVRALEWVPGFSRKDPGESTDGPGSLAELHPQPEKNIHPLLSPRELKNYQYNPEKAAKYMSQIEERLSIETKRHEWKPTFLSNISKLIIKGLGLQATNLFYCYLFAIIYGFIAYLTITNFIPPIEQFTRPLLIYLFLIFGSLLSFSFFFVGSSLTEILIEFTILVNATAFLSTDFLSPGTVFGIAQAADAAVLTIILHWLTVRFAEDELSLGQLRPAMYVGIAFGYSEIGFLFLILPTF